VIAYTFRENMGSRMPTRLDLKLDFGGGPSMSSISSVGSPNMARPNHRKLDIVNH
jgi:hypothetical protein